MAKILAVAGKGGTGKTTVTGLILKYLKEYAEGPVLALDADPDANLGTVLGIPVEKTIGDLREETLKEIKSLPPGMNKSNYIQAGLHQIVVERPKIDMITMGRSEGPGCYCYINSVMRKFSDDLQADYAWVVMDNEAGLEHLSRRTASNVDALVVVVNANPLALDCARRIDVLTDEFSNKIRRKYILINNVTEPKNIPVLEERIGDISMEYLGYIPYDKEIEDSIFNGQSLFSLPETSAVQRINEIMSHIQEELWNSSM
jgi:CO dehydrogenase maturation factor